MKTNLLTTALLLATTALFAQESSISVNYYDSTFHTSNKENYKYKRVIEYYKNYNDIFLITDYLSSGIVSMKAISTNKNHPVFEGPRIDYYENGNKRRTTYYSNNMPNGIQTEWYENNLKKLEKDIKWNPKTNTYDIKILKFWNKEGQLTLTDDNGKYEYSDDKISEKGEIKNGKKQGIWEGKDLKENFSFTEIYNDGILISGISTDENNNKYQYKEFTEKATPAKGIDDFYQYLSKNYKTPKVRELKGKIYLSFIIDKDGSIRDIKVLRDIGNDTGQEGIKTIASYGKWIPEKTRGIPVKALKTIPIAINDRDTNYQDSKFESRMNIFADQN
jgi:antitoxin component YwqK of YwqJK toxin-antitoxin module